MDNDDLWAAIDKLLQKRPPDSVLFTKVKGHASEDDVTNGLVLALDKVGNDSADILARAGARHHPPITEEIKVAQAREAPKTIIHSTYSLQKMSQTFTGWGPERP